MKWEKLGHIFVADNNNTLMCSHGRAPICINIGGNIFRTYFGSCDTKMRGRIYSLEFDINQPTKYYNLVEKPVLDIGNYGFYDDNGISPSWIIKNSDGSIYLYTIGYSAKNKVMFDAATGIAKSYDNGETFVKEDGSVIDRSFYDPVYAACPSVLLDDGMYKAWYVSGDRWEKEQAGSMRHYYNIKYRESSNGIDWSKKPVVAIDYGNEYEYAIARPAVIKENDGLYKMWYCFRAQKNIDTYRIGYAESRDGIDWVRKDELMKHFDVSESGWDSEMLCYPYVFDHNDKRYMLYNGNDYGRTGFGLAVLEEG